MFQEKVMTEIVGYLECKDFKKDMKTETRRRLNMEIHYLSALEIAEKIKSKEISSLELTQHFRQDRKVR